MIRPDRDNGFLTAKDLFLIAAIAFPTATIAVGVIGSMENGAQTGVNLAGITGSFLLAAVSFGRILGQREERRREVRHHKIDPCVEAGEHIEGCIFMEPEKPKSPTPPITSGTAKPEAPSTGQVHHNTDTNKVQFYDGQGWRDTDLDFAEITDDTPGGPVLNTEIAMCMECGNLLDDSRDQRRHQGKQVDRCLHCARHGLCIANPDGPHQRIVWPEDPDFDPAKLQIGPLPDTVTRIGYCPECREEFRQVGDAVYELTWADVGWLWAAQENPELLNLRRADAVLTNVTFSPPQAPGGFWFGFDTGDKVGYHFVHRPPLVRGSRLHSMLSALGREDNADYDDDDLRIMLPKRGEKGKFRLTLNGDDEIVEIAALPCPDCDTIHTLEKANNCVEPF